MAMRSLPFEVEDATIHPEAVICTLLTCVSSKKMCVCVFFLASLVRSTSTRLLDGFNRVKMVKKMIQAVNCSRFRSDERLFVGRESSKLVSEI